MPSPSVSALHGSVRIFSSRPLESPSPSESAEGFAAAVCSEQAGAGGAVLGAGGGSTTGEWVIDVKRALKRRASTRRRKRVASFPPVLLTRMKRASLLVSVIVSFVRVALSAL